MIEIDIDDFYDKITKFEDCYLIGRYNGIDVYFNFDVYTSYLKDHFRIQLAVEGLNVVLNNPTVNFYNGKKYEVELGKNNIVMICQNCEILFTSKKCNLSSY